VLPARPDASAGLCESNVSVRLSVCLSVRSSVTRQYYAKMKKDSVTVSSPFLSRTILVFCCQISSQNSKGVTRSGGVKQGRGGKISSFLSLSLNMLKTVADTAKVTINDSHMGFQLTPRSIPWMILNCCKVKFS